MAAESEQKLAFIKSFICSLYLGRRYYARVATFLAVKALTCSAVTGIQLALMP